MNAVSRFLSRLSIHGLAVCAALLLLAACGAPVQVAQLPTLQAPLVPTRIPRTQAAGLATTVPVESSEAATIENTRAAETAEATAAPIEITEANIFIPTEPVPSEVATANTPASTPASTPGATLEAQNAALTLTADAPTNTHTVTETPTLLPPTTSLPPTQVHTNTLTPSPTITPIPASQTPPPTHTASNTATSLPPTATLTSLPPTSRPPTALPTEGAPDVGAVFEDGTSFATFTLDETLTGDTRATGTIDDNQFVVLYRYTAESGTAIDVELSRLTGNLDPFLLILDPKGREIARGDDLSDNVNSAIRHVPLTEAGDYTIVATRGDQRFGTSEGNFELAVKVSGDSSEPFGSFAQPIAYDQEATGTLGSDITEQLYTFRGQAGDIITIEMDATSGNLDTRLFLSDNLGSSLAYTDDDVQTRGIFTDSTIADYTLTKTGFYSIIASQYLGTASRGDYALRVSQTGTEDSVPYPFYAPLVVENSRSLSSSDEFYSNFAAGDGADAQGNVTTVQTLITFYLPPLPEEQIIGTASFILDPCYVTGPGFDEMGDLTIYQDRYGRLGQRQNIQRPFAGARILAETSECGTFDVTEAVTAAYAEDQPYFQLRLIFRDPAADRQGSQIAFSPRLLLSPEA